MQNIKADKVILGVTYFMIGLALLGFIGTALYKPLKENN